jgi:GMP synthase-like glutamine amidotransferase
VRIVCLQHVPFEGPAEIATWAASRGHVLEVVRLYEEDAPHPADADFLIIMGGPMSIHEEAEHPYLAAEKSYVRAMMDGGALVLGVCLGAQLLAHALGARVFRGEHAEIGWYPVTKTTEADGCPVMRVLPDVMNVLHWHGDTFDTPAGAIRTYASKATSNQAFSYDGGRVIGLQFHLEQSPGTLASLAEAAVGDLVDGEWIQPAEEMLSSRERFTVSNELLHTLLDAMAAARANS